MDFQNNITKQVNQKSFRSYFKDFDKFEDGYNELITTIPEFKVYGGDMATVESVVRNICKITSENVPSISNPSYPNTISISISSKEVGVLTDESIAFGWRIAFNKELNKHVFRFRVTFLSKSMNRRMQIKTIMDLGWSYRQNDIKNQNSFWKGVQHSNNTFGKKYVKQKKFVPPTNDAKVLNETPDGLAPLKEDKDTRPATEEDLNKLKETVEGKEESVIAEEVHHTNTTPKFSIKKAMLPNVFIVMHRGLQRVVNVSDNEDPEVEIVEDGFNIENIHYDTTNLTCEVFEREEPDNIPVKENNDEEIIIPNQEHYRSSIQMEQMEAERRGMMKSATPSTNTGLGHVAPTIVKVTNNNSTGR